MNKLISNLYAEMTTKLQETALAAENPLQLAQQSCVIAELYLTKLKELILDHDFEGQDDEIDFFKNLKPMFLKELIYFREVFQVEAWKPPVGRNEEIQHYMLGARRVDLYFKMHNELYTYYRTGSKLHDGRYFLRGQSPLDIIFPLSLSDIDPRFSTPHSFLFAEIQAYEQFSRYLQQRIYQLEHQVAETSGNGKNMPRLVWTDQKTDLIEWGYAIFAGKSVNSGKATVREIMTALEAIFNVSLGNYQRAFWNMRTRKKNLTPFIDTAKENLIRYMNDDNNMSG